MCQAFQTSIRRLLKPFVPGQKRDSIPPNYADLGVAPGSTVLSVTIGLKLSNLDQFIAQFLDISDPNSPNYGNFLSAEGLAVLEPPKDQVDLALTWLKTFSIDVTYNQGYLTFNVTVDVMSKLFQAEYHIYKSDATGQEIIRTLSYGVPSVLSDLFEMVLPGIDFDDIYDAPKTSPGPNEQALAKRQAPPSCNSQVTPACLQSLYGILKDRPTQQANILSVAGFLKEYANRVDGGQNPQVQNTGGIEANLDIQYTVGLVNGGPVNFISSGMGNINGFINMAKECYGFNENQVSQKSAQNLCNVFAKLGARGISVIVASGDGGVAGSRPNNTCTRFVPTFPASCPFVTLKLAWTCQQAVFPNILRAHFTRTPLSRAIFNSWDQRTREGSNPSCGTQGFPAKTGFDCVTGMGTPNFQRFATAVGA
ncbi:hypothetical protein BG003_009433 [Podila horticola]|nr:hypothetical protein BG003_009433 [Podila horticola]